MADEAETICRMRLAASGYAIVEMKRKSGPFAATVFDLTLSRDGGAPERYVYKQPPPDRTGEFELYEAMPDELAAWLPPLAETFREAPCALLLRYVGEPLLEAGSRAAQSGAERGRRLSTAAAKLAELHLATESLAERWVRERILPPYAYSREWADWTISQLERAARRDMPALDERRTAAVAAVADSFYAGYGPDAMRGAPVFTHGDPHWGNVLVQDGRVSLIDWEWCRAATPMRDVAILLQEEPDDRIAERIAAEHAERLAQGGHRADPAALAHDFRYMMIDNSLMMLGWDVELLLRGERSLERTRAAAAVKASRILTFWNRMNG